MKKVTKKTIRGKEYNVTVISNKPSQQTIENFNKKLAQLIQKSLTH